jgi:ferritin-like metal-binding protein YciE
MEQTALEMLEENAEHAQETELKELFRHHQEETQQQIRNLEQVFSSLGWEVDDSPCPAIEGIQKEGTANVKKTDDAIVDNVILQGAAETEHHEIAVYEGLITSAKSLGREDVVAPLQANLEQERHTLDEVHSALERVAQAA